MKILVIGSGGREHAISWRLSQSRSVEKVYCAPGNPGISEVADCVALSISNFDAVADFCVLESIDLVVVGPEEPLVNGMADALRNRGIAVFGPSMDGARLEASKAFTKALCMKYGIPTAAYAEFSDKYAALAYLDNADAPIVVKADGLAAGKGVVVASTIDEAKQAVVEIMDGRFGEAGNSLVIEEFLEGEEVSFFALTDGKNFMTFGTAQDHKRAYDGDKGPNTGGMGTLSPAYGYNAEFIKKVEEMIITPTINGLIKEGIDFRGVLFAGLMVKNGEPKLLEYNCRFGDPETQVLMARFNGDLGKLLHSIAIGKLDKSAGSFSDQSAVCVVMASKGYPGDYKKGTSITRMPDNKDIASGIIFHAGTSHVNGTLVATGGRVLGVTAWSNAMEKARENAYSLVTEVVWENGFYRSDIGSAILKK